MLNDKALKAIAQTMGKPGNVLPRPKARPPILDSIAEAVPQFNSIPDVLNFCDMPYDTQGRPWGAYRICSVYNVILEHMLKAVLEAGIIDNERFFMDIHNYVKRHFRLMADADRSRLRPEDSTN